MNTLLLYGNDTYRSKQKLDAIKAKYVDASLGDTNLAVVDGQTVTVDELVRALYALPFLAKSRLVVIRNLLTAGKAALHEKVLSVLDKIPATTVTVFYEQGEPDKRNKLYKKLNQPSRAQRFDALSPARLGDWINRYVSLVGAAIEPAAVQLLINTVGPDLWRMQNELEKLTLLTNRITRRDVGALIEQPIESNIFALLDGVGERNPAKAFGELNRLLQRNEPALYILTMLHRGVRTIAAAASPGNPLDLHPYALQKAKAHARNLSRDDLQRIYQTLAAIDWRVKIGTMDPEVGAALVVAAATQQ